MTFRFSFPRAALLALTLSPLWGAPAQAVTLNEAVRYARGALSRLCADRDSSRFSRIEPSDSRDCRVSLEAGRLFLELTTRRISGLSSDRTANGRRGGVLRQEIRFDARSHFYCSGPDSAGYSTLYMNCVGVSSRSGKSCVSMEWETLYSGREALKDSDRRSFATVIAVRPDQCGRLERAMNFIAERSRGSSAPPDDDPFR